MTTKSKLSRLLEIISGCLILFLIITSIGALLGIPGCFWIIKYILIYVMLLVGILILIFFAVRLISVKF